jgi:hypothetical protein
MGASDGAVLCCWQKALNTTKGEFLTFHGLGNRCLGTLPEARLDLDSDGR